MTRRDHAPSRVTIYRPAEGGALVRVPGTAPVSGVPSSVVRGGAVYGIWHDLVQAWQGQSPCTLEECARRLASGEEGEICFVRGEFFPAPLNSAERKSIRAVIGRTLSA